MSISCHSRSDVSVASQLGSHCLASELARSVSCISYNLWAITLCIFWWKCTSVVITVPSSEVWWGTGFQGWSYSTSQIRHWPGPDSVQTGFIQAPQHGASPNEPPSSLSESDSILFLLILPVCIKISVDPNCNHNGKQIPLWPCLPQQESTAYRDQTDANTWENVVPRYAPQKHLAHMYV